MLTGILRAFDTLNCEAEVKSLSGCTTNDTNNIINFYDEDVSVLHTPNPSEI